MHLADILPEVYVFFSVLFEGVKVYFCTARDKDFYAQLLRDGNVAVTGMNREYQMIRLSGKAHRLDDQKLWIDRIFAENPSMNSVYPDDSRYVLEPFY